MLLRRYTGQRLEPMGIMGCSFFDRPFLHLMRDDVRRLKIQILTFIHNFMEFLVDFFRKAFLHNRIVKNVLSENIGYIVVLFFFAHFHNILSFIF